MISKNNLIDYVNTFNEAKRDAVYKEVIDSELLNTAFESAEGKLILSNCIDLIAYDISNIVKVCRESEPEEAGKKAYKYALEMDLAYKLLVDWAIIIVKGESHKEKIK